MNKILVPIDGSENALRAVKHAIAVAKSSSMELHLLYVQEPMPTHVHAYFSIDEIQKIEASATNDILQVAKQFCDEAMVPCVIHTHTGAIAQTIAACVDELQCNAVIMGTRGMSAIANLIIGSVTTKVVHLVNVPVTLVK